MAPHTTTERRHPRSSTTDRPRVVLVGLPLSTGARRLATASWCRRGQRRERVARRGARGTPVLLPPDVSRSSHHERECVVRERGGCSNRVVGGTRQVPDST